jgi:NADH:ubiquinone oxidoreductase subunit E
MSDSMKASGSHVSSEKDVPMLKAGTSNANNEEGAEEHLDSEVEQWFATVGNTFPRLQLSIIPMLQAAQAALGYLPHEVMQVIARHLVVPPALVEGVASFYAQFRFNKPGRHRITVCTGTACYVRGSGKLIDDIEVNLKIASGETTADGAVSLESVSCFGACALAPVVVVDDKVLRQQTSESMKKVVQEISSDPSEDKPREIHSPPAVRGTGK